MRAIQSQQESSTALVILERIPAGESVTYLVPSDSDPDAAYLLYSVRGRVLSCGCRGWQFRSACRHATRLQAKLDSERCAKCHLPAKERCPANMCPRCCSSDEDHRKTGREQWATLVVAAARQVA